MLSLPRVGIVLGVKAGGLVSISGEGHTANRRAAFSVSCMGEGTLGALLFLSLRKIELS
jgi:hypothetical protein